MAYLRFSGGHFDERIIDANTASKELATVQELITELSQTLWKRNQREPAPRLPKGFKRHTTIYIERIDGGSVSLPIYLRFDPTRLADLETDKWARASFELACKSLHAMLHSQQLPSDFPASLLGTLAKVGKSLPEHTKISVGTSEGSMITVTAEMRSRLLQINDSAREYEDEITGRVESVNAKTCKAVVAQLGGGRITIPFDDDQKSVVIKALTDHPGQRIRARIGALYNRRGQLLEVLKTERIELIQRLDYDPHTPLVTDTLRTATADTPEELRDSLPSDLAVRHDLYAYDKE